MTPAFGILGDPTSYGNISADGKTAFLTFANGHLLRTSPNWAGEHWPTIAAGLARTAGAAEQPVSTGGGEGVDLDGLREALGQAAADLLRYGNHGFTCGVRVDRWLDVRTKERGPCDCGYGAALTAARAALSRQPAEQPSASAEVASIFKIGDRVTKRSGSSWTGRVVGRYSTTLTPEGYAVESENEPGSVQIYPAAALSRAEKSS